MVGAAIVAAVLVGSNVPDMLRSSIVPGTSPSAPPAPFQPSTGNALPIGTYLIDRFAVPFTFDVRGNWVIWEYDARVVTPTTFVGGSLHDGGGGLAIFAVDRVVDPTTGETIPAPADLAAWIQRHPDAEVLGTRAVSIGGLDGVELDIRSERGLKIAPQIRVVWEHRIGLRAGSRRSVVVLEAGGWTVLILGVGPADSHQRHLASGPIASSDQVRELLESLRFSPATP